MESGNLGESVAKSRQIRLLSPSGIGWCYHINRGKVFVWGVHLSAGVGWRVRVRRVGRR